MKSIGYILFLALLPLAGCDKDDNDNLKLPPATQTGARTFGCLVDGKVFVHNDGVINCFYQLVEGEYYFGIQGEQADKNPSSISLGTIKMQVAEGESYDLLEEQDFNALGNVFYSFSPTDYYSVTTSPEYPGKLTITNLDFENNIVSGTFWFDIPHPITGETVEIRDGRFDTYFTQ